MAQSLSDRKLWLFTAAVAVFVISGFFTARLDARPPHIDGKKVAVRVDRVMEHYGWQDSIEELKQTAAKQKKLIFWLQIVGELDGGL